jgi:hypothetical protein
MKILNKKETSKEGKKQKNEDENLKISTHFACPESSGRSKT